MTMNDNKFREECRKISKTSIHDFIIANEAVGSDLVINNIENAEILRTSALLYIVANMPISNQEKNNCAFCSIHGKGKKVIIDNGTTGVFIDVKRKMITYENKGYGSDETEVDNYTIRYFPIAYCPVCGRQL